MLPPTHGWEGVEKSRAVAGGHTKRALADGYPTGTPSAFGVATATGTGKHGAWVIPLCGTQLIKPPACRRCLTLTLTLTLDAA